MSLQSTKTEQAAPTEELQLAASRLALSALAIWFIGLGSLIGYVLVKRGHLWMLPSVAAIAAVLLAIDHLLPSFVGQDSMGGLQKNVRWIAPLAVALAISFTSSRTLYGYFQSDDFAYLHYYHVLSWPNVLGTFHTDLSKLLHGFPADELRPMYGLFFMLNWKFWGLYSPGYRVVCLLLHFANCLLIFQIVNELVPRQAWRACVAALMFAVVPINSDVFFWITGAPAEIIPALFYLASFLAFTRYRATRLRRYGAMCVAAFAGCLLCKESAITLPAMLLSFDVWRVLRAARAGATESKGRLFQWRALVAVHVANGVLLAVYLIWRRIVLGAFLKERQLSFVWLGNSSSQAEVHGGFLHRLVAMVHFCGQVQIFHVQNLLLPFSLPLAAVVGGMCFYWAISFWQGRGTYGKFAGPLIFFGIVWYAITNIPLLIVDPCVYHMYLPTVGVCIALPFLIFPTRNGMKVRPRYVPVLTCVALIVLWGVRLYVGNGVTSNYGILATEQRAAFDEALSKTPKETLVLVWPDQNVPFLVDTYPYPLEVPFSSIDLPARGNLIVNPGLSDSFPHWWRDTRAALEREWAASGPAGVEVNLVSWDDRKGSLRTISRVVPKSLIRARTSEVLGISFQAPKLNPAESENLMQALAGLVTEGR